MSNTIVIRNPTAGRGATLGKQEKAIKYLSTIKPKPIFYTSKSKEDFITVAKKAVKDYEIIAIIAGDSAQKEAAEIILDSEMGNTLAPIPGGSVGDFPRGLGFKTIKPACSAVIARQKGDMAFEKKMDVGCIEYDGKTDYFLGSVALLVGLEVQKYVEKRIEGSPTRARYRFIYGFPGMYTSFKEKKVPKEVTLEYNDVSEKFDSTSIMFNNTSYLAKIKINPDADPFDGKLNACVVNSKYSNYVLNSIDTLITSLMSLVPMHTIRENVTLLDAEKFKLRSNEGLEFLIDGEVIGPYKNIEVYLKKSALKVIVPKTYDQK